MALGSVELQFALVGRDQLAATLKKGEQSFRKMGKSAKKAADASGPFAKFVGELRGLPLTVTGINQGFQLISGTLGGLATAAQGFVQTMAEAERGAHLERTFERLIPKADQVRDRLREIVGGAMSSQENDRFAVKMDIAGASVQDTMAMFEAAADLYHNAGENLTQNIEQMMGTVVEGDETIAEWLGDVLQLKEALDTYAQMVDTTTDKLTENQKIHARMIRVTSLLHERQKTLGMELRGNVNTWQSLATAAGELPERFAKAIQRMGEQQDTLNDSLKDTAHLTLGYDQIIARIEDAVAGLGDVVLAPEHVQQTLEEARHHMAEHPKVLAEMNAAIEAEQQAHETKRSQIVFRKSRQREEFNRKHHEKLLGLIKIHSKTMLTEQVKAAEEEVRAAKLLQDSLASIRTQQQKLDEIDVAEGQKRKAERDKTRAEKERKDSEKRARNRQIRLAREKVEHDFRVARLSDTEKAQAEHERRMVLIRQQGLLFRSARNKAEQLSEMKRDSEISAINDARQQAQREAINQELATEASRLDLLGKIRAAEHPTMQAQIEIEEEFAARRRQISMEVWQGQMDDNTRQLQLDLLSIEQQRANEALKTEILKAAEDERRQILDEGYQVAIDSNSALQSISKEKNLAAVGALSTLAAASAQTARDFERLKKGSPAAVAALSQVAAGAIKDTRAQAGIMAVFSAAESALMFAKFNYVGAASAATAAALYASIAAGAGAGSSAKQSQQRGTALGTGGGGAFGDLSGGASNVTVNVQGYVGSAVDLGVGVANAQSQLAESNFRSGDTI